MHDGRHEPYDEPDDVHADAADGCFNVEHVNEFSIQQCIFFYDITSWYHVAVSIKKLGCQ